MEKTVISLICLFCGVFAAQGQEYKVASMSIDQMDLTARTNKRIDNNGTACAVLKIFVPDKITKVEGNIIGPIESDGIQKLVYVTAGSKQINLLFENHYPLRIVFDDYNIPTVSERMVYVIKLTEDGETATQSVQSVASVSSNETSDGEDEFKRAQTYYDESDYQSAVYWLKKAADKGHAIATSDVGLMYEYGIGVPVSITEAEKYYKKAASLGYDYAKSFLFRINAIKYLLEEDGYDIELYYKEPFFAQGKIYFTLD